MMSKADVLLIDNVVAWMWTRGCGGRLPRWPTNFTTVARPTACTSASPRCRGRSATWSEGWVSDCSTGRAGGWSSATPAGRCIDKHQRALTESDRAVSLARLAARGDWGELAISVLPAVTLALLPAIIRAYRDAHPAIGQDQRELRRRAAGGADGRADRCRVPARGRGAAGDPAADLAHRAGPGRAARRSPTRPPRPDRPVRTGRRALRVLPRHRSVLAYDEFIASCRAAGFSPAIAKRPVAPPR